MSLKSLMEGLKNRVNVPLVPSEKLAEGTPEPAWTGLVPSVPCVPLHVPDAQEKPQNLQSSETVHDQPQALGLMFNAALAGLVAPGPAEPPDPDRWCWPHSSAMTGREIDVMIERTALFNRRGLSPLEAEILADKLVNRDREGDDRRVCLECQQLSQMDIFRCEQWQRAGLGASGIPDGLQLTLQRCGGFTDEISNGNS